MTWKHGRASARPGKHGPGDYRAEFGRMAPTLGESVFVLGFKLLAEDRYNRPNHHRRHGYLSFLREVACADSPEKIVEIAQRADEKRAPGGLPGFVRCCDGGTNDCVSLCKDCYDAGHKLPYEVRASTLRWWGLIAEDELEAS